MTEENSSSTDSNKMQISINFVESLFQSENQISNNESNCQKSVQAHTNSNTLKKKTKNVKKINLKQNHNLNSSASSQQKRPKNKTSLNKYNQNKSPLKNVLTISTAACTHRKMNSSQLNYDYYYNNNYLNNYTTSNYVTLHKAIIENKREKKLYQDQLQLLKNHINKLRQEEEDLNKKMKQAKLKEQAIINHHIEKENLKKALESININKQIALEEKKKSIMEKKIKSYINLKEKREKYQQEKVKKYLQIKNERKIRNLIVYEKNMKDEEYVRKKVEKIKNERERMRKINLTKRENNNVIDETDYNFDETEIIKERIKEEIYRLKNEEMMRMSAIRRTKESLMNEPYIRTIGLYNSRKNLCSNRSFGGSEKKQLGRVRSMKLNDVIKKRNFDFSNMYD